ncbi:GAF domain-containing protein [Mycobacterium kansasii]|uniref:Bacterial regulatory helix-turn-helix, lysR family protein n=2 Tax=Mycobacterium kansasii TaxID=1768 RepID=A0A1V3X224_MYCKA|nr:helix-turn-helix domain-containing protein [Mycobacterium kansasii]EUA04338.1 bacterial regulatory helix-turn-helix, lysR family protein [Mycobacterium kansasii 824]AGZ54235.1 hypothetical protein MKAN_14010 [Mycobacterium kansasii ATCC 12478]ARG56981.1 hypothetical protein B1T43_15090 [Mycobacterium kansasii]ARG62494.1 hypothetical protein B1T45_15575 [Mycobacterium kansasii]ARG70121.1 hypothetical protein B1T47_14850 [Mycobacterium kansasii]
MSRIVADIAALLHSCRAGAAPSDSTRAIARLADSLTQAGEQPDLSSLQAPIEGIRSDYAGYLRRETELYRLLQTAQRLLGTAALEELLGVIVEATRDLIGSQVAHLNLVDRDEQLSTIRATTGARTETFRLQHTPAGAGFTGLVLRLRSPYVTKDYLSDPAIEHDPSGDASVRADHLVTMAGAPMLDNAEPLGVLMVSWRRPVTVTDEQVDLLTSLASLAAVAVAAVRRHEEARRSRIALEDANENFRRANSQLEWGAQAHDRLLTLLLPGTRIDAVAETVNELLEAKAAVLDPQGLPLAAAPLAWRPVIARGDLDGIAAGSRAVHVTGEDGAPLWAAPAHSGGEPLAVLVVERDDLLEMEHLLLERAATATALLLATRHAISEAQFRSSADLVTDLVRGRRLDNVDREAAGLGLELSKPNVVLVTSTLTDRRRQTRSLFRGHADRVGGLSGEIDGHLVAILPLADPHAAATDVATALHEAGLLVAVGASGPATRPSDIEHHYATALDCATAQDKLTGHGPATIETLGFVGLLLANPDRARLSDFVHRRVGALEEHDTDRHTSLIPTLEAYLDRDRSIRAAARHLHVHTNTVQQRLQRIETLLDVDLHTTNSATELHLALRLRRLLPTMS